MFATQINHILLHVKQRDFNLDSTSYNNIRHKLQQHTLVLSLQHEIHIKLTIPLISHFIRITSDLFEILDKYGKEMECPNTECNYGTLALKLGFSLGIHLIMV